MYEPARVVLVSGLAIYAASWATWHVRGPEDCSGAAYQGFSAGGAALVSRDSV
jgi:hypothetical protein